MRETRTMYLHTINNSPAWWSAHDGRLYCAGGIMGATLHASRDEIVQQQQQDRETTGRGEGDGYYGYVHVEVPRG